MQRLVDQIAEQNREEDRAQKVRVEQVALALKEKFVYVQESEREMEGKMDMQGWARVGGGRATACDESMDYHGCSCACVPISVSVFFSHWCTVMLLS